MTDTSIRRIQPADAGRARSLRLEMLADAPLAFVTTLAEASERPHADYAGFVTRCSAGRRIAIFVAEAGGHGLVGQAGGAIHSESEGRTLLFAVYVSPRFRGRGVLGRLVDAVAAWSREAGRPTLELEVVTSNRRAEAAYRKLGFAPVGEPVPHPTYPILREQILTRPA